MLFSTHGGGGESSWASIKGFSLQVFTGRWFMMFASSMIMSMSGASYMFGLYSEEIKSVLGYDQSTLNMLSSFKDIGSNLGIIFGLIYEVTPPWVVLTIGGVLNFFGYFMIWLVVTRKIAEPQFWIMCLYNIIGTTSHCGTNTGALMTGVKNFPGTRGIVSGILTGYLGLSPAIITQLYYAFSDNDSKSIILLMAWLPTATAFVFLPVIRNHRSIQQPNDTKAFYRFLYLTLVLSGFLMVAIMMQKSFTFTQSEYYVTTTVMLLLLILPIAVVIEEEHKIWESKQEEINCDDRQKLLTITTVKPYQERSAQAPHADQTIQERVSCWQNILRPPPQRGEDHTILQGVFNLDMVLIFSVSMCGIGSNLTVVNNLSQIGTSLGYPAHTVTVFVSLMAIWNHLGQITQGVVSELIMTKFKVPRPVMLTSILVLSSVGHLLIALNVPNGLYVAAIIVGFCFGANWPILLSITSEIFGLKHISTLYGVASMASPVGSYFLGVSVAGYLYDREARRQMEAMGLQPKPGEELNCNGSECYSLAFIIITLVCLFGALVSLILVLRTRKFYKSDLYKKFKEAATGETERAVLEQDGTTCCK